jgi:hypothetical protein
MTRFATKTGSDSEHANHALQRTAAGALPPQRSLSSLRVTSRPSSRRSDSALKDMVDPGNGSRLSVAP